MTVSTMHYYGLREGMFFVLLYLKMNTRCHKTPDLLQNTENSAGNFQEDQVMRLLIPFWS